MKHYFLKWLLAAAMAIGCTTMTAGAFSDTAGHWAESAINKWSQEYGIIQGYDDGTFRPDNSITRGAFAGILDRFLHFQTASPANTFSDTAGTYWEDAILKLHASGVYLGNGGKALSGSTITRQQAVAMIGRAFNIAPEVASVSYTDGNEIAEYALSYVAEFESRGYLTDCTDGRFRPTDPITRAEIVNILGNMVHTLIQENTTWTQNVQGNLLISAAEGATLRDLEIGGDLILAPGVQGTVTLTDTVIDGSIRNYGTGQVVFGETQPDPEPEEPAKPGIQPSEVYTPGATLNRTLTYNGTTIPIYRDRPLNVFSNSDFIWTKDETEEPPEEGAEAKDNGRSRLKYLGDEFRTRYGIDVSSFQGDIDWDAVAEDDIDFAMVRVGFRGTGTGSLNTDKNYVQNIRGAMRAGLETGVYFFAQAVTVEEAIEEADYVISLLDGLDIDGPVAYDWEMHDSTYRVYGTSPEMATACAVAFCERIKDAGYNPMVYGGTYVSYMKYDQGALADYLSWYPEYKSWQSEKLCPTLVYHMDYWQFSSSRSVAGINGRVDMNIQFQFIRR